VVTSHENLLTSLRQSNPTGAYNLIMAGASIASEIDEILKIITQN
jgi:hypothetical protein